MSLAIKIVNWFALVFAGAIVLASLTFAYVLLTPIDVLESWEVKVDDKIYHPGEDVILHTSYKKVKDVSGTSYRYLECENKNGSLSRYPISQSEGNRPKGEGRADTLISLPSQIPGLPTTCRIAISVDYTIYSFRTFTENTNSNYFKVEQ